LQVLAASGLLPKDEFDFLCAHGERVRRHAGQFP
jgi:hypothetical protein